MSTNPSNYDAGIAAYERGHHEVALYDFEKRAMKGDGDRLAEFSSHGCMLAGAAPHNAAKTLKNLTSDAFCGIIKHAREIERTSSRAWYTPTFLYVRKLG